jgi:protein-S-isoprenylcysteine O-methyltransferase Ste14
LIAGNGQALLLDHVLPEGLADSQSGRTEAAVNEDLLFRITVVALMVLMKIIRWPTRRLTGLKASWPALKKNPTDMIILFLCGLVMFIGVVAYLFFPQQISSCNVGLAVWLRWASVAVAVAALALLGWADHYLGNNLSVTLEIKDGHTLITGGPYRWIRHPLYASALLFFPALSLISANWFVGVCFVGGIGILVASRIPREEKMLAEKFGDRYHEYIKRTGCLLPRMIR